MTAHHTNTSESEANRAALQDALPPTSGPTFIGPLWRAMWPVTTGIAGGICIAWLVYAVQLPMRSYFDLLGGLILAAIFGGALGLACGLLTLAIVWSRDPIPVRAVILGVTALVAALTAAWSRTDDPFTPMGAAALVYLFTGLCTGVTLPPVWRGANVCRACGYDLRASLEFGRCPECGRDIDARPWYERDLKRARGYPRRITAWAVRHPYLVLVAISAALLFRPAWNAWWHIVHQDEFDRYVAGLQPGEHLDFSALSFRWDHVFFFGPYSSPSDIDQALGLHWPDAETTGIERTDSFSIAVFTRGRRVVDYLQINRGYLPVVPKRLLGRPLDRTQARFTVDRDENGTIRLIPPAGPDSRPH